MIKPIARLLSIGLALTILGLAGCPARTTTPAEPAVMVVMDPLAKELACPCVAGYGQRNYSQLATYLAKELGRPIRVIHTEALDKALRMVPRERIALIIGKQSLVRYDAAESKMNVRPLARLTDPDGKTTFTGLFVVKADDPATTLADLKGRRIFFGTPESDEKHSAAQAALQAAGVALPTPIETRPGCSDAALEVQDSKESPPPAAVISSYAFPLLEGCGSLHKGSLKVIGHTAPLPFVTLFATDAVTPEMSRALLQSLLRVRQDADLLQALESQDGFVDPHEDQPSAQDWPDWRGPARDGIVPHLPTTLPATPNFLWKTPMPGSGLAGIAVASGTVVVAGRDLTDQNDLFCALNADTGDEIWRLEYPAPGKLDFGQSPRATPVIRDNKVYLLGAFGDLHCVALADGKILWQTNLLEKFHAKYPTWGMSATPLIIDDKLIVNPGAPQASLVALDRHTGQTLWQTPGPPAAYAAFIVGTFGGRKQIVGYDAISLGGWDISTGQRLWQLIPPNPHDYNVPTPIDCNGQLLVATENNGTRLYAFDSNGVIQPKPLASHENLTPDVSTPVVVNGKVFGICNALFCLDLNHQLKPLWSHDAPEFNNFVSLIASPQRILITTFHGQLILLSATAPEYQAISQLQLFNPENEIYSHPALANGRLFIRGDHCICCVDLGIQ